MKKSLQAAVCIIVLCSALAVPLLLQPPRFPSDTLSQTPQGASQSLEQNYSSPIPETSPGETSQTASPNPKVSIPSGMPTTNIQPIQQNGPQETPLNADNPSNRTLREATDAAINYFGQTQEPYALLLLNVLYRQFGITDFADSLQRYDQLLASSPENAPLLRIFRRIANYSNTVLPEDIYAVTAEVDKLTVPALYSDRGSLPDGYMSELTAAANNGGYMLTHALLATIWLQDNHCDPGTDFREYLYHASAGLIDGDTVVTDLELEAAAFLCTAGQGALVDTTFVQSVINSQTYDGGWSYSSGTTVSSNWHSSVLGLMLLLYVEFPAVSYPPMLASGPS